MNSPTSVSTDTSTNGSSRDSINYKAADTTVILLAAGRGQRMRELTDSTPKPLLKVAGPSLIERHCQRLQQQGFRKLIVNLDYCAEQIREQLGDGSNYGLSIAYSDESYSGALETAGGIRNALTLIKSDPFLVVNADIVTDYPFAKLLSPLQLDGRLVLVPNPQHNLGGDFSLSADSKELYHNTKQGSQLKSLTFSGIALYRKRIFEQLTPGKQALAPVFKQLIAKQLIEGEHYDGLWHDIGTPERLQEINALLANT